MDSTTTPGNEATSGGAPGFDQPADAVAMTDMQRSSAARKDPTAATESPKQSIQTTTHKAASSTDDADSSTPLAKQRRDSNAAIGPAQDDVKAAATGTSDGGPVCNITLLLTSGGRHPYKIDARYLTRRNVVVPDETESGQPDPFSISVYTLKELILREWRNDWEAKPASPSSIRLIHFGKLLEDKEQLKKYQFSNENPNVVHMSIRPSDLDEEEPKTGSKSLATGGGDGHRSRGGANCCVIL
ncbi:hypothetical protein HIM_00566 [Hirsutella minnesotensis 3608]|nr:hypothetical protein HIM_00566 [Hirsutella minnesotensis 3608]